MITAIMLTYAYVLGIFTVMVAVCITNELMCWYRAGHNFFDFMLGAGLISAVFWGTLKVAFAIHWISMHVRLEGVG